MSRTRDVTVMTGEWLALLPVGLGCGYFGMGRVIIYVEKRKTNGMQVR